MRYLLQRIAVLADRDSCASDQTYLRMAATLAMNSLMRPFDTLAPRAYADHQAVIAVDTPKEGSNPWTRMRAKSPVYGRRWRARNRDCSLYFGQRCRSCGSWTSVAGSSPAPNYLPKFPISVGPHSLE